jgi:hypothetical protein
VPRAPCPVPRVPCTVYRPHPNGMEEHSRGSHPAIGRKAPSSDATHGSPKSKAAPGKGARNAPPPQPRGPVEDEVHTRTMSRAVQRNAPCPVPRAPCTARHPGGMAEHSRGSHPAIGRKAPSSDATHGFPKIECAPGKGARNTPPPQPRVPVEDEHEYEHEYEEGKKEPASRFPPNTPHAPRTVNREP